MPIYDYEYNGKIYSFESDAQPNEQEVMDFIGNYKEPVQNTPVQPQKTAQTPIQQEEKPIIQNNNEPIQGSIEKNYQENWDSKGNIFYTDENGQKVDLPKRNLYENIRDNLDATLFNIGRRINRPTDAERTSDMNKAWGTTKLGLGLLTGTPLGFASVEGLGSFGDDFINDKQLNPLKAGLTAGGAYIGGKVIDELLKTPLAQKGIQKGSEFISENLMKGLELLKDNTGKKASISSIENVLEPEAKNVIYANFGKNISNPTKVTNKISSDASQKVSQLGRSDFVNNTIGQNINKNYDVLTNEELIKTASNDIAQNSNAELSDLFKKGADEKSELSAIDFEKGRQLISKLYQEGRVQEATNLIETLTAKGTKAGQAVQAMSLWGKTTPEGAEMFAQRVINKYNDAHPKNPIVLSQEARTKIRTLAENIQKLPDGYEKDVATATMLKEIGDQVPRNFGEKFRTLRNISRLLNGKTFMRNITGNSILGGIENTVTKPLAAGIDKVVSLGSKQRTRVTTQGAEYLNGLLQGFKKGNNEVKLGINTRDIGGRFDVQKNRTFKTPVLKALETATDWSLRVPDSAFYEATLKESIANQIQAEMLNKGLKPKALTPELIEKYTTPKIVKQATDEALESVFQNNGNWSNFVVGLRNNTRFGKDIGIGDLLIPYAQTPANVAEMTLNYSPVGLGKGIYNLVKGNQRQAMLDLARGSIGSGLIGAGYSLGKNGIISPAETNYQARANNELIGERPNTLKIGDTGYSYQQLQPLASLLAGGSAIANSKTPTEAVDNAVKTLVDTSMLRGINQFLEDNEKYGTTTAAMNTLLSAPSQVIPTLLNQVNAYIDPIQRETFDPNPVKRTVNYTLAQVPFASKTLPAKYNVKGEEKQKFETDGVEKAFDVFVNPIFKNKKKDDIVAQEIIAVSQNSNENVLLPLAKNKIKVNGEDIKLNGDQLSQYQKALGSKTYEALEKLMQTSKYANSDDNTRAEMIKSTQKYIKTEVDAILFGKPNTNIKQLKSPVERIINKQKRFESKINKIINTDISNQLDYSEINYILEE